MNCEQIQELIQNNLDLSLSNEQKVILESHIDSCSACRDDLNRYKKIQELLAEENELEVPEGFTDRVMNALPEVNFDKDVSNKGFGTGFEKLVSLKLPFGLAMAAAIAVVFLNIGDNSLVNNNDLRPTQQQIASAEINKAESSEITENGQTVIQTKAEVQLASLTLSVESGVVKIKSPSGALRSVTSGQNTELSFKDELETGLHAVAHVVYPEDKVRLGLKSGTRMQIARNSVRLYYGDSWVHVVKKGTRFEVQTPNLIAAVRGTMFSTEVKYSLDNLYADCSYYLDDYNDMVNHDSMSVSVALMQNGLSFLQNAKQPSWGKSTVSVFEGVVNVQSLTSETASVDLHVDESVSSVGQMLSKRTIIGKRTIEKWADTAKEEGAEVDFRRTPEGKPAEKEEANSEIKPTESFDTDYNK